MNERFFQLEESRQAAIVNAAYKVFALNDYRKAPMSEIALAGGVSKSLLFHYFGNKLGLYLYLWNKAIELNVQAAQRYQTHESDDLFQMLERSLAVKCELMREYPYLTLFCMNAYYEEDPDVRERIQESFQTVESATLQSVAQKVAPGCIREGLSLEEVLQEIMRASDGFLLGQYRSGNPDPDKIEREYASMIGFWRRAFGAGEEGRR